MQLGFGQVGGFSSGEGFRPDDKPPVMKAVKLRADWNPLAAPGIPQRGLGTKPTPAPVPAQEPAQGDRTAAVIDRLCAILIKFSEKQVDEDVAGRIFWSYVDDAKIPPSVAAQKVLEVCPDLKIPAKPVVPVKELKKPEKEGFHGKTQISLEEAAELLELLDVVLAPLTPEEAASQIADSECLRELNDAGGFPLVERLQARLRQFMATAQPGAEFTISHGEAVVTGKAVECAEALGRVKTIKTVATVGGVAAGSGALLLLLGLL